MSLPVSFLLGSKTTITAILITLTSVEKEISERAAEAKIHFNVVFHLCLFSLILKDRKSSSDFLQGKKL